MYGIVLLQPKIISVKIIHQKKKKKKWMNKTPIMQITSII